MVTAYDRQLTQSFLFNFIRTLGALLTVLWAFHGFTLGSSGRPVLALLTDLLGEAFPLALLVATLFTVSSAARHHEVTALKTAGWPLHRIMGPLLGMGAVSIPVSLALGADRVSPLVNGLAVVFGIVLGATRRERSMFSGFLTAALVLVGYFVVSATAQSLGRHGVLPQVVSEWSPLVLFSALACLLWSRAAR